MWCVLRQRTMHLRSGEESTHHRRTFCYGRLGRTAKPLDRSLYDYLFAFRTEGAKSASLQTRHKSIRRFFKNVEVK